jgi:hypothetical protein
LTQAVVVHPCARCGSTRLWNVRELKETEGPLAVAYEVHKLDAYDARMHALNKFGSYELLVCAQCGHIEWFARHFDPSDGVPGVSRKAISCAWCKQSTRGWRIETAEELVSSQYEPTRPLYLYLFMVGGGMGRFHVEICAHCGHAVWTGYDLDIQPSPARGFSLVNAAPCRGCGSSARFRRTPLRESNNTEPALALASKRWFHFFALKRGTINVDVCRDCGLTDWNADTGELEEGLEGLSLIEIAEIGPQPPRGPYR